MLFYFVKGANAIEFIVNHAEVSLVFVQENKIPAVSCYSFIIMIILIQLVMFDIFVFVNMFFYPIPLMWEVFAQILSCLSNCFTHLKSESKLFPQSSLNFQCNMVIVLAKVFNLLFFFSQQL